MEDLGELVSYLTVRAGVPVYDRDADRVGVVEDVLADEDLDIFHGLIVRTPSPFDRNLFAYRDQIAELRERGVVLSTRGAELYDPAKDAPAHEAAEPSVVDSVETSLRAAWEWLRRPR